MSTGNLTKGYWQLLLRPQDREKTIFVTPKGLFQFAMMPFDFHGVALTFQCLVDARLGPCEGFSLTYFDDIIIFSKTWEDHLTNIKEVYQCLQQAGLKVNPMKSKLGFIQLEYLEYGVGKGCLQPQQKKVKTVSTTTTPKIKKQLCQFLKLAGYYSWFILHFTTSAASLSDRLQTHQLNPIVWDKMVSKQPNTSNKHLCPHLS